MALSLVELSTNLENECSKLKCSRSWFAVTNRRFGTVFWEMICGLVVRTGPMLLESELSNISLTLCLQFLHACNYSVIVIEITKWNITTLYMLID